jgi:hypothetical protein
MRFKPPALTTSLTDIVTRLSSAIIEPDAARPKDLLCFWHAQTADMDGAPHLPQLADVGLEH